MMYYNFFFIISMKNTQPVLIYLWSLFSVFSKNFNTCKLIFKSKLKSVFEPMWPIKLAIISSFCNKKESGVFPLPNGWKLGLHKLPTAVNFQYPIKHFLWREGERLNQSKILKLRLFSLKSRTLTTSLSICPTTVSTVKSLAQLPRTLACRSK